MSDQATARVMTLDVPPVAKLVLWVLAKHAGDDGSGTFATPDMMRAVVSQTTPATMKKHTGWLLGEGYIREGDQDLIPGEWTTLPRSFRPVVYDLALDEETRLAWKAAYNPRAGRRGAAAEAGRRAGLASAARRAASAPRSENQHGEPAPRQKNQHEAEVAAGTPAVSVFSTDRVASAPEPPCKENEHAATGKTNTAAVLEKTDSRVAFSLSGGVGGEIYLTQEKTNPPTPRSAGVPRSKNQHRRPGTVPAADVPPLFPAIGVTALRDNPAEVDLLAAELHQACAGKWSVAEISRTLTSPKLADRTWDAIRRAALTVLPDPVTNSPNRLHAPGPWWTPPPKPTPAPDPMTDRTGIPDDHELREHAELSPDRREELMAALKAKSGTIRVSEGVRKARTG